ncbi:hypothetical protein [Cypionkella sp.]|uniref:hypothetical protein n=1 Tax=Cypionkella sp. TaxID=2811411 RepID=UPI002ABB1FA2|nr:hypothetical protein [Cypionkella sp.]MDZ4394741.1 hypothetical protein [Cypionkella sp.]
MASAEHRADRCHSVKGHGQGDATKLTRIAHRAGPRSRKRESKQATQVGGEYGNNRQYLFPQWMLPALKLVNEVWLTSYNPEMDEGDKLFALAMTRFLSPDTNDRCTFEGIPTLVWQLCKRPERCCVPA